MNIVKPDYSLDYRLISDDKIMSHPLVQELSKAASISDFKIPFIIKDKTLMEEGNWNNHYYSGDTIERALSNTDWSNRSKRDLFLDHEDERTRDWIGEVQNIRMDGKKLVGDLIVYDLSTAIKLQAGKPKFGISPKVKGKNDIRSNEMKDFVFDNFSVVMNPAVKTAYINNSDSTTMKNDVSDNIGGNVMGEEAKPVSVATTKTVQESQELSEFVDFAKEYLGSHSGASVLEVAEAYKGIKKGEKMSEDKSKMEKAIQEMKELIASYDSKVQPKVELPSPTQTVSSEMAGIEAKLSAIEAKFGSVEKLVSQKLDVPDRRSVPAQSVSADVDAVRVRVAEAKANPDLAFTKYLRKNLDMGEVA